MREWKTAVKEEEQVGKKIVLFLSFIILCGILSMVFLPKEEKQNKDAAVRIGYGSNIAGTLAQKALQNLTESYESVDVSDEAAGYSFQDC